LDFKFSDRKVVEVQGLSLLADDFNSNGFVDAADYVVWRRNLGSSTSLPNDSTAGVGANDCAGWRINFGAAQFIREEISSVGWIIVADFELALGT